MAHYNDHPDELKGFQLTMYKLANFRLNDFHNTGNPHPGPSEIAEILYTDYYEYVAPKGYPKKHTEYKAKNIAAIKKCVERDFLKEDPWKVSSGYMYAYSLLFHVSMDYLYGKEEYFSDDYDVLQICKKTTLSEKAVEKLLSDDEVYICDFVNEDISTAIDEDAEYESISEFWNKIIESDLYHELPESYYRMACASFFYKLCKKDEEEAYHKNNTMLSKKDFLKLANNYIDQTEASIFTNNMSLEEVYDQDKDLTMEIIKDINHSTWYDIKENLQQIESIYWGCLGQFDRFIQNYFHENAEKYQVKLYTPN